MPAPLSSSARRILQALLDGRGLAEIAPAGTSARAEVESYLAAGLDGTPVVARGGRAVLYSDGASRGNPGPSAIAFRIVRADGVELAAEGRKIGRATNNVAEYRAAIAALERARDLGVAEIELRMDSELVVKQIHGEYRVKQPALAGLKAEIDALLSGFRAWRVRHVPREKNAEADHLANEALEGG
jgi:ribonuclease HI